MTQRFVCQFDIMDDNVEIVVDESSTIRARNQNSESCCVRTHALCGCVCS